MEKDHERLVAVMELLSSVTGEPEPLTRANQTVLSLCRNNRATFAHFLYSIIVLFESDPTETVADGGHFYSTPEGDFGDPPVFMEKSRKEIDALTPNDIAKLLPDRDKIDVAMIKHNNAVTQKPQQAA